MGASKCTVATQTSSEEVETERIMHGIRLLEARVCEAVAPLPVAGRPLPSRDAGEYVIAAVDHAARFAPLLARVCAEPRAAPRVEGWAAPGVPRGFVGLAPGDAVDWVFVLVDVLRAAEPAVLLPKDIETVGDLWHAAHVAATGNTSAATEKDGAALAAFAALFAAILAKRQKRLPSPAVAGAYVAACAAVLDIPSTRRLWR